MNDNTLAERRKAAREAIRKAKAARDARKAANKG